MTLLAPAKINLFLHITGRRADGYHLLQSAFELIDWADRIDLQASTSSEIVRAGDLIGPIENDLAVRAARALQATPQWAAAGRPGAMIRVEKSIPFGAGLGGGSSDAASTLIGLNRLWGLGLAGPALAAIGLGLGADVPFFLFGRAAFAQGIGEDLQAYETCERAVVVAVPATPVATAPIFAAPELTRNSKPLKIADFAQAAVRPVWVFGHNDLQPVTRARFPEVDLALNWLSQAAASEEISPDAVRMSGSGGAVFCTAPDLKSADRVASRMQQFMDQHSSHPIAHLRVCRSMPVHPETVQQV